MRGNTRQIRSHIYIYPSTFHQVSIHTLHFRFPWHQRLEQYQDFLWRWLLYVPFACSEYFNILTHTFPWYPYPKLQQPDSNYGVLQIILIKFTPTPPPLFTSQPLSRISTSTGSISDRVWRVFIMQYHRWSKTLRQIIGTCDVLY
jgi:hypothetical protein